jgi:hypothetical protein
MGAVYSAINIIVEAMTEPECSEVHSESTQDSETYSRKRSLSYYNTDTSVSISVYKAHISLRIYFKIFIKNFIFNLSLI